MSLVVGLTGGIGSGKSLAADCFAALGVPVVDADVIAHELTAPGGAAMAPIEQVFGREVLTSVGALDRAAMRNKVFARQEDRARLEAILHPRILEECARLLEHFNAADYVVLVVPLLVESDAYRLRVDRIAVVDCPEEMQIARVMARNSLSRLEIQAIMAAQSSRMTRLAQADDVIVNDADPEKVRQQVKFLHRQYIDIARRHRLAKNHLPDGQVEI